MEPVGTEKKNRNWIWLFAVLFVLAASAAAINWGYNRQQQLTDEQLAAAREMWKAKGPADYDLTIRKEINAGASSGPPDTGTLTAEVRAGRVIGVTLNDHPLEQRLWQDYDVAGCFDWIERFLEIDSKPTAPRVFCRAIFDPTDGHPISYVRSVSSTHERQELRIELKPANQR
jgi:hypothetical protein